MTLTAVAVLLLLLIVVPALTLAVARSSASIGRGCGYRSSTEGDNTTTANSDRQFSDRRTAIIPTYWWGIV